LFSPKAFDNYSPIQLVFVAFIFPPLLSFYNCQFPDMVIEGSHANKYDKIFKENMEYALPGIIKNILGLTIVNAEEISHDLQHTIERKPDVLRKVTDQNNRTYILHVELQS
jgi:hypothetical protein